MQTVHNLVKFQAIKFILWYLEYWWKDTINTYFKYSPLFCLKFQMLFRVLLLVPLLLFIIISFISQFILSTNFFLRSNNTLSFLKYECTIHKLSSYSVVHLIYFAFVSGRAWLIYFGCSSLLTVMRAHVHMWFWVLFLKLFEIWGNWGRE